MPSLKPLLVPALVLAVAAPAHADVSAPKTAPRLTAHAYRTDSRGVQLLGVKVEHVTKGAVVRISCTRRCPSTLRFPITRTSGGSTVSLVRLFERARLRPGTAIFIRTSGAGVRRTTSRIYIYPRRAPLFRDTWWD